MTDLGGLLTRLAGWLDEGAHPWALVGGLAVSARAEPRFTRDVDVAVAVESDEAAEALVRDARRIGLSPVELIEHDRSGRLAMVRCLAESGLFVDLLFWSSGIESEIAKRADRLEVLPGVGVPVATVGDLVAWKLLAMGDERPQDAVDLKALRDVAVEADRDVAAAAVAQITALGAHRGRALDQALNRWWTGR